MDPNVGAQRARKARLMLTYEETKQDLRKTKDLTFDELYTEYIVNGRTQTETAKLLNSTVDCVAAALHKFNIKRTPEQSHDVMSRGAKKVRLTPEQKKHKELNRKATLFSKYGEDYYKQWKVKADKTVKDVYGVDNAMFNAEVRQRQAERAKEVQTERHDEILATRIETCLARHGVENVGQCEDHTEKMQATSLKKFGVKSYSQTQESKDKVRATWDSKTSEEIALIKQKAVDTCMLLYGVPYNVNPTTRRSQYFYKDSYFDSSYELIFFIAREITGTPVKRNTDKFSYFVDKKEHFYYPDFIDEDNNYIEIKGAHFFDKEGHLINPFTEDVNIQSEFRLKGELMEYLGVQVIKDIEPYRTIVDESFGPNYVDQFRVVKS